MQNHQKLTQQRPEPYLDEQLLALKAVLKLEDESTTQNDDVSGFTFISSWFSHLHKASSFVWFYPLEKKKNQHVEQNISNLQLYPIGTQLMS